MSAEVQNAETQAQNAETQPSQYLVNFGIDGLRALYAVSLAAAKDDKQVEERAYLNHVLVRVRGGKVKLAATNGHVLAYFDWPVGNHGFNAARDGAVLVPASQIASAWKECSNLPTIELSVYDEDDKLAGMRWYSGARTWEKVPADTFPRYENVVPTPKKPNNEAFSRVGIDARYLTLATKMFKLFDETKLHIEVPIDPLSPFVFSSKLAPVVLVVMPMRINHIDINPLRLPRK